MLHLGLIGWGVFSLSYGDATGMADKCLLSAMKNSFIASTDLQVEATENVHISGVRKVFPTVAVPPHFYYGEGYEEAQLGKDLLLGEKNAGALVKMMTSSKESNILYFSRMIYIFCFCFCCCFSFIVDT